MDKKDVSNIFSELFKGNNQQQKDMILGFNQLWKDGYEAGFKDGKKAKHKNYEEEVIEPVNYEDVPEKKDSFGGKTYENR